MNETSCNFYTTTYRGCIESLDWFNCDAQTIKTWDYHPKSIYRKTNINIWKGVEYQGPKNDGGLQRVGGKYCSGTRFSVQRFSIHYFGPLRWSAALSYLFRQWCVLQTSNFRTANNLQSAQRDDSYDDCLIRNRNLNKQSHAFMIVYKWKGKLAGVNKWSITRVFPITYLYSLDFYFHWLPIDLSWFWLNWLPISLSFWAWIKFDQFICRYRLANHPLLLLWLRWLLIQTTQLKSDNAIKHVYNFWNFLFVFNLLNVLNFQNQHWSPIKEFQLRLG